MGGTTRPVSPWRLTQDVPVPTILDRLAVKNAELWQELLTATEPHRIEWHWVKGHSGHAENDRVDALACAAADALKR